MAISTRRASSPGGDNWSFRRYARRLDQDLFSGAAVGRTRLAAARRNHAAKTYQAKFPVRPGIGKAIGSEDRMTVKPCLACDKHAQVPKGVVNFLIRFRI